MKKFSLLILGLSMVVLAQTPTSPPSGMSETAMLRMSERIRKEILSLNNYGLFDDIRFSIKDYVVTLRGQASRPTLKTSIENAVKRLEGVEKVVNEIEVLPLNSLDDSIRLRTYIAIYGHPALARYNPNRGTPVLGTLAQRAGGITNDPPPGWHPIHILVKNGNVRLEGVLQNSGDVTIAFLQANAVPGTFVVENNLRAIEEAKPKRPRKR